MDLMKQMSKKMTSYKQFPVMEQSRLFFLLIVYYDAEQARNTTFSQTAVTTDFCLEQKATSTNNIAFKMFPNNFPLIFRIQTIFW